MSQLKPNTQTRVRGLRASRHTEPSEILEPLSQKSPLASQSGQAIIEYILLIVVVLALAFGLAQQLFTPVRDFTQFVLGDYIECLLDQGQLPALGGESRLEDCEFDFEAAFGSASSGGSGGSPAERTASSQNQSDAQRRLAERPRGGGSTQSAAGRGSRRFAVGGASANPGVRGSGPTVAEAESRETTSRDRFMRFRDSRALDRQARRRMVVTQSRFIQDPRSLTSPRRGAPIPIRAPTAQESSAANPRNDRFQVDPNKPLRTPKEINLTADWNFGVWFRYFLILVILIALILFIAGQVNQISKSMEKS